jgi:hypothetical protein
MRGGIVLRAQPGTDPPLKNEIAASVVGEPGRGESQDDEVEALRETFKHGDKPTEPGLQTDGMP